MKVITHFVTGATIGIIYVHYVNTSFVTAVGYIMLCAFFGILPDCDIILEKIRISKHRNNFVHSISFAFIIFGLIIFFNRNYYILSMLAFSGILIHLLLDGLTFSGVKLFYPFSNRKLRGNVKYNSIIANTGIIIICIFLIFGMYSIR